MQFSAAAILAFVATAVAQYDPTPGFDVISKPAEKQAVPAGETFEIVWAPSASYPGTVSISLIGGATQQTLVDLAVVATGVDSSLGTYSWAVDSSLGAAAVYGLRINLESNTSVFQYSFPFTISGGKASSSSTASGSASVTSASASTTKVSTTSSVPTLTTSITTPIGNLSTSATAKTTVTSTFTPSASTTPATKTTSGAATVPTSGASLVAVGPLAMLGAVAAAVFAL